MLQSHATPLRLLAVAGADKERPVFHKEIGARLRKQREARAWSVQRAVIAARKKHPALTLNRLRWLEEGKTKFPDAEVLLAIADIYGMDYDDLARSFITANYGRDLLEHRRTGRSGTHLEQGVSNVPALDELRRRLEDAERTLDAERKEHAGTIKELRAVAGQLLGMLAGPEDQTIAESPAKVRRGHRRTR